MVMSVKQLVILFVVMTSSLLSFAEEKKENKFALLAKDVYFQPGGGLRVRYDYLDNATGKSFINNEREGQATHRAQFDFKLYKGEYIETFFRLINSAEWGGAAGDTNGGQHDGFSNNNGLLVNQAWALWKFDDQIGVRFGRAPLDLGLGYTYGLNDWFNVPYSFDLFDFVFDWESAELSFILAKVQELTRVSNQTTSSDPEENHIIVNLGIDNLIDTLSVFNFSLVQVNRDLGSADGGVTVLNGLNMQRLALEFEVKGKRLFGSGFISYVTGDQKIAQANQGSNPNENLSLSQNAFDFKVGYRFPESNNIRLWTGFHFDSGDSDPTDDKTQTYDSFYYDVYGQSGLMDLIRWGNLNFYRFGLDMELFNGCTLGSEWLSFSKAKDADGIQFGNAGRFLNALVESGDLAFGSGKDLGSEFDIWLDFDFESGMKLRGTFATFFPGAVFENATASSGSAPSQAISQFLIQLGYAF